jgi:hypothetical protein
MLIDARTGNIQLPNQVIIPRNLGRRQFEKLPIFRQAVPFTEMNEHGYELPGGQVQNKPLRARLYFANLLWLDRLQRVVLYLWPYGDQPIQLEEVILTLELESKAIHDALLRIALGEPHGVQRVNNYPYPRDFELEICYQMAWGKVVSSHDHRNQANTEIVISYR